LFIILALAATTLAGMAGFAIIGQTRSAGSESGRLVAVEPTIDLGRVPFDRVQEARFVLVNSGGAAVHIMASPAIKTLEGC